MWRDTVPYPNNIKHVIKRLGYNIGEVAEEAQIPERTMRDYLKGKTAMPEKRLRKVAEIIGCTVEELRGKETSQQQVIGNMPSLQTIPIESGDTDMDPLRRHLITTAGAALIAPSLLYEIQQLNGKNSIAINNDNLVFFESEMASRWDLYHTGGADNANRGLDTWIKNISQIAQFVQGTQWHSRALVLLCMSYQLQGCIYRDKMLYPQAHLAHQKAFQIARELDDMELMAAAISREGLTYLQQEKSTEAIIYLSGALETIGNLQLQSLRGYTQQALSEAYAIAQFKDDSIRSIGLAEQTLSNSKNQQERDQRNQSRLNTASVIAQRGVNAVLLHDNDQAIRLIDKSLLSYNPTLIRGRARLLAQKAQAHYELDIIDACISEAQEALVLAQSVGSKRVISRVKSIHDNLVQSSRRKERGVARLSDLLFNNT